MALNLWQCAHTSCTVTATGTGGAIGLRAIGWQFLRGALQVSPHIFCPNHRHDEVPCRDEGDNHEKPCALCSGDDEADMIQHALRYHKEDLRAWWAATKLAGDPR